MPLDLSALWDFTKPEVSEQRFRTALLTASANDAFILQTQIARTYGLRRDFAHAQMILAAIEPQIPSVGVEAQVRYYLELGRTYASATHPSASQTTAARELARSAYMCAAELAQTGNLDSLAIDALHIMTFVDTAPEEQIVWNQKAMTLMNSSSQEDARRWAGALHNNTGYALHQLGRYEEALSEFNLALAVRERDGNPRAIRIARWMIAWTLRALGHVNEAMAIQLRLEQEWNEAGEPDPYVFEELEQLYRSLNNHEQADYYAARRQAIQ